MIVALFSRSFDRTVHTVNDLLNSLPLNSLAPSKRPPKHHSIDRLTVSLSVPVASPLQRVFLIEPTLFEDRTERFLIKRKDGENSYINSQENSMKIQIKTTLEL
jgi:hypothetical protein